ncbi:hypothetical protein OC845_002012 [Tilletia horrida]|nr:hypothetical protein OC845_002012 [Tilletia horrida]
MNDIILQQQLSSPTTSNSLAVPSDSFNPPNWSQSNLTNDDDYMSTCSFAIARRTQPDNQRNPASMTAAQLSSEPAQFDTGIQPEQAAAPEAEHSPDEEAALAALEDLVNPDRAKSLVEARQRAKARRQRIASMTVNPVDVVPEIAPQHTSAAPAALPEVSRSSSSRSKLPPSLTWSLSSMSNSPLLTPTESSRHHQHSASLPGPSSGYFPEPSSYHEFGVPIYGHNVPLPPCLLPGAIREPAKRRKIGGGTPSVSSPLNPAFSDVLSDGGISSPGFRKASSLERSKSYAKAYAEIRALDSGLQSVWMSRHDIDAWAVAAEMFAGSEVGLQIFPTDQQSLPGLGLRQEPQEQQEQASKPSGGFSWSAKKAAGTPSRERSPYRSPWSNRAKIFVDSAVRPSGGILLPSPPCGDGGGSLGNSETSDSASSSSATDPSTADSTPHTSPVMATFPLPEEAQEKQLQAMRARKRTVSQGGVRVGAGLIDIPDRRASIGLEQHADELEAMETIEADLTPTRIHPGLPSSSRPSSRASQMRQMISLPFSNSSSSSSPSSPQVSPRKIKGTTISISGPMPITPTTAAAHTALDPSSAQLRRDSSSSTLVGGIPTTPMSSAGLDGKKMRMRNLLRSRPSTADASALVEAAALSNNSNSISSSTSWFGGKGRGLGLASPSTPTPSS